MHQINTFSKTGSISRPIFSNIVRIFQDFQERGIMVFFNGNKIIIAANIQINKEPGAEGRKPALLY